MRKLYRIPARKAILLGLLTESVLNCTVMQLYDIRLKSFLHYMAFMPFISSHTETNRGNTMTFKPY